MRYCCSMTKKKILSDVNDVTQFLWKWRIFKINTFFVQLAKSMFSTRGNVVIEIYI